MNDDPPFIGKPGHAPDERAHDVVVDIVSGRTTQPARDQLRDVLDKADKAPVGRAKSDAGLGRATAR